MNLRGVFSGTLVLSLLITACVHRPSAPKPAPVIPAPAPAPVIPSAPVATTPVYVPDTSHQNDPLPDGILAWDGVQKNVVVSADKDLAPFSFSFTNITKGNVTIMDVHPSCGCTKAEHPPTPWTIPAGGVGRFTAEVNLNIAGHGGTLFKTVMVTTDKGRKQLLLTITVTPPVVRKLTDAERQMGMQLAKMNRQAVFHGDCASCHANPKEVSGLYGQRLYDSVCGVCHEAEHRASVVPDLSKLTVPTNLDFWRTWITYGKPGTLMPAFAQSQSGPLTDMQIESLAAYLNSVHPSRVPPPQ
jgi:cytochrome c553